jgi:DNA-binding transcriptional MerR regulator
MPDTDTHSQPSNDPWVSIGEAARQLGVSVASLQRWDREDVFKAHRTITNQRRYRQSWIDALNARRTA